MIWVIGAFVAEFSPRVWVPRDLAHAAQGATEARPAVATVVGVLVANRGGGI